MVVDDDNELEGVSAREEEEASLTNKKQARVICQHTSSRIYV